MGEITDMMLDGTLCGTCGVYIEDGQAQGFPRYCSKGCDPDHSRQKDKKKRRRRKNNRPQARRSGT